MAVVITFLGLLDRISGSLQQAGCLLEGGIVRSWSRGAEILFGRSASEVCGQPVGQVVPALADDSGWSGTTPATIEAQVAGGRSMSCTVEAFAIEDRAACLWVEFSIPVEAAAEVPAGPVSAFGEAPPLSESWYRLELERIAYALSHDMRAPVRAVQGFTEIVRQSGKSTLDEQDRHYLNHVVDAGRQLDRLLTDLVAYVRCGRQGARIEAIPLDLPVQKVLRELRSLLEEFQATVTVAEGLPMVQADSALLTQVLLELLKNAVQYAKPGEPPVIRVGWRRSEHRTVVLVTDEGVGIDPTCHEKIFELSQRLVLEEVIPGSGTGLATARKGVELMGGRIWVESASGAGSTFCIELLPAEIKTGGNGAT